MACRASGLLARSVGRGVLFAAVVVLVVPARGAGQPPDLPSIPIAPLAAPEKVQDKDKDKEPQKKADKNGNGKNGKNGDKDKEKAAGPELALGECLAVARDRSPALRAAHKTYEATAMSSRALNDIGTIGAVFAPDLPIRKEQAARGLIAATADIQKVESEIVHDVTRLYFTVVYATQQEALADDVVAWLEALAEIAERLVQVQGSKVTKLTVDAINLGLAEARVLQLEAQTGRLQAMAGLREVMAVDPFDPAFGVKDKELPVIGIKTGLTREFVIAQALACRPEMALAAAGVDAFRLEVFAQARVRCSKTVRTFASGSDIHARQVPQAERDGANYRPGAIAPEMPPQLVGSMIDRVGRARTYCERAEAVYDKTRGLVALEAEAVLVRLDQATTGVALAKEKSVRGKNLHEWVRNNFDNEAVPKELLVTQYVAGSRAQSDYVRAVYQHLLALAALERVTAGAIRPPFPGR